MFMSPQGKKLDQQPCSVVLPEHCAGPAACISCGVCVCGPLVYQRAAPPSAGCHSPSLTGRVFPFTGSSSFGVNFAVYHTLRCLDSLSCPLEPFYDGRGPRTRSVWHEYMNGVQECSTPHRHKCAVVGTFSYCPALPAPAALCCQGQVT